MQAEHLSKLVPTVVLLVLGSKVDKNLTRHLF